MKWTPELNKCVMRCHFTAAKSASPVKKEQCRIFLLDYPHLAAKVSKQRNAN